MTTTIVERLLLLLLILGVEGLALWFMAPNLTVSLIPFIIASLICGILVIALEHYFQPIEK